VTQRYSLSKLKASRYMTRSVRRASGLVLVGYSSGAHFADGLRRQWRVARDTGTDCTLIGYT